MLRTDGDPSGNRYARGLTASAIGQVFGPQQACSATVVESPSGRVAVTAAHCVYWPAGHPEYNPFHHRNFLHLQQSLSSCSYKHSQL
jgi:hypothetical protein